MTDEFENVRIGNWQIRLPSQICTDPNIFYQIFSSNTWTNLLNSEQRARISEMLPKELHSRPGETARTMDDLFSGSLTRFGTNPLKNFFSQLDAGHFDPGVVETKKEIKKVWRKDALRRRKKYHTDLLEQVVVSRETHLKKFNAGEALSLAHMRIGPGQEIKVEQQHQNLVSIANENCNHGTNINIGNKNQRIIPRHQQQTFPSENHNVVNVKNVAKRIFDEVTSVNNAVRGQNCSVDGPPVTKKPTMASVAAANKIVKPKTKVAKILITKLENAPSPSTTSASAMVTGSEILASQLLTPKSESVPNATPIIPTPVSVARLGPLNNLVTSSSSSSAPKEITVLTQTPQLIPVPAALAPAPAPKTREEQAAAQMAKFPKILPAPSTSSNSKLPQGLQQQQRNNNQKPTTMTINSKPLPKLSTNNPTKSSPILASQLQAPVISSSNYSTNHTASFRGQGQGQGLMGQQQQQQLQNFQSMSMSMDDMESSSDDEFEAIEPTIGFSPNLVYPKSKQGQNYSRGGTTTSSRNTQVKVTTTAATTQSAQVKLKLNTHTNTNTLTTTARLPNLVSTPKVNSQKITVTSSQILLTPNRKTTTTPGQLANVISNFNTAVSSVTSNTLTSTPIPIVVSSSNSNFLTKQLLVQSSSGIVGSAGSGSITTPKLLPISIANIQNLNPHNKVQKLQSYFQSFNNVTTSTPSSGTTSLQNGPPSVTSSLGQGQIVKNSISKIQPSTTTLTASVNCGTGTSSSSTTTVASPLTLSLSDLNLNLNLGLSLDSSVGNKLIQDALDDKIDDLSVLDGNPFDSIPNLSDELDGFDLDLVDGLCDFDVLLSEEKQYASFFSLIRDMLCSTRDHRMTLVCLERAIRKWALSPIAALNLWFLRINDWNDALITALNFLAGNYQGSFHVHPEDFVPYIEYKYKTKYYQWIGAGRDSDNNLLPLCNMWLENLDRLPPLKKHDGDNEDQEEDDDENEDSEGPGEEIKKKSKRPLTPPPPRCVTDWTVRPSTLEEKEVFQQQERVRFENPHKAFTYQMHSYESVVGPVKGVYSSQSGMTNKARGHSLLVDDRPPYVTILALVRDAVARLPNGEGTRSEICEMLRDSAFLAAEASNVTLNSVVSGALDRLHYERDPCVRYDSHKKSWIYLHRDRTQEQFERLHHNRSYTKSTKSRSNTSRKSRKQSKSSTQSQSQGSSQSSSGGGGSTSATASDSTPTTPSTAASVVSAGDPPPLHPTTVLVSVSAAGGGAGTISLPSAVAVTTATAPNVLKPLPPVGSIVTKSINIPLTTGASKFGQLLNHDLKTHDIKPIILDSIPKTIPQGQGQSQGQQLKDILTSPPKQTIQTVTAISTATPSAAVSSPLKEMLSAGTVTATVPKLQYRSSSALSSTVSSSTTSVVGKGWGHHTGQTLDLNSHSHLGGNSSQTLQIPSQTVQLQVQGLPSSTAGNHIVGNSVVSVSTSSGTLQPNATLGPGQFLLGSNTLLRFASNVRFPEGVRFAQLRLPIQQNGPGSAGQSTNPLRLPQHRILLTRGTLPGLSGHGQTQGVLLGQTATGQTIILSTTPGNLSSLQSGTQGQLAPFTVSTQAQAQPQQRAPEPRSVLNHALSTNQSQAPPPTSSLSQANPTLSLTLSAPSVTQTSQVPTLTSNISNFRPNVNVNVTTTSATPIVNMMSRVVTSSAVTTSGNTASAPTIGTGTTASTMNVSQLQQRIQQQQQFTSQQQMAHSVPSLPSLAQVKLEDVMAVVTQAQAQALAQASTQPFAQTQGQTTTQTTQGTASHPQLGNPIIIRSNQGDFVIPAHISLGRGMHGIKVIPVSGVSGGKQTLLARLVAPGGPLTSMTPSTQVTQTSVSHSQGSAEQL